MAVPLIIEVDETVLPALDAAASRRRLSREAVVRHAIAGLLAAAPVSTPGGIAAAETTGASAELDRSRDGTDAYLAYLDGFLDEWNTPEDADAFDPL